jgi:hypothetical protein
MIINQAIYGDKSGAYSLLATSFDDIGIAKRICNVTDVLDRPSSGYLSEPIIRGFAFDDYYLFIKSFPDNDASVRKGRVFSHVLIVNRCDLDELNDLELLISHFFMALNKDAKLAQIEVPSAKLSLNKITSPSRKAGLINGLIEHDEYSNTILWEGEEDYISAVSSFWHRLPSAIKAQLNLGVVFNLSKIDSDKINLLYFHEGDDHKWRINDTRVIYKEDREELNSIPSYYIAGDIQNSASLVKLIDTFNLKVDDIDDYDCLARSAPIFNELSVSTDFNGLISFCYLITQYNLDKNCAHNEKEEIVSLIIKKIVNAENKQISALKNINWNAFNSSQKTVVAAMKQWLELKLNTVDGAISITDIIVEAFLSANDNWWTNTVIGIVKTVFNQWRSTHAKIILSWLAKDNSLLTKFESIIPKSKVTEEGFISHWSQPTDALAELIRLFCQNRQWLVLHGITIIQLYDVNTCLKIQLALDKDEKSLSSLQRMAKLLDSRKFISVAVETGDIRLIAISAQKISKDNSLIKSLDIKNISWRRIWLDAIKLGSEPWTGIKQPHLVLFELLGMLINGSDIENDLLVELGNSSMNDLTDFQYRKNIWPLINVSARKGFLDATTIGCVKQLDKGMLALSDIEPDIQRNWSEKLISIRIFGDSDISVLTKLELFDSLDFEDDDILENITRCKYSGSEATKLGQIILNNNWKNLAEIIGNKFKNDGRYDLSNAAKQCSSIVIKPSTSSFFDPFGLWSSSYDPKKVEKFERTQKIKDIKFKIALSFPGEKRTYAKKVADQLKEALNDNSVFYDMDYKAQLARPNLDTLLQSIYHENSELLVVFLCKEYTKKEWCCNVEWRAIKDLIKAKEDSKIMFIRFDNADISGVFSGDGYIDANTHSEAEVAELILQRLVTVI